MSAPATWYVVVGGNDVYWRVELPARALGARHVVLPEADATEILLEPHEGGPFPWHLEIDGEPNFPSGKAIWDTGAWQYLAQEGHFRYPEHEGVAVWTRAGTLRARHAAAMADQGILAVTEYDDNLLSPMHLNMFMRASNFGPREREAHLRASANFDRIIFSTEWLRDEYAKAWWKELRCEVPETFVCQNHVLLEDWPERSESKDGRLRVGWMGSPQHARDIRLAQPALAWAYTEGCDTILMGHDVRDEEGVVGKRAIDSCRAWRSMIRTHIPWQDPAEYHRTALPFDIGVAPLELNAHTLGKSDVKAIEYAMSGAVPLLQNHPVYAKNWKHNETCLLANGPNEFTYQLRELVRSPSLRERLVSAAQQYVREERSDKQLREEWGEAISAV